MNLDLEPGSPAGPGLDVQPSAEPPGPLVHPVQPAAADIPQLGQVSWRPEAGPIVGDGQQQPLACPAQADAYLAGPGVLFHVAQGRTEVSQDLTAGPG